MKSRNLGKDHHFSAAISNDEIVFSDVDGVPIARIYVDTMTKHLEDVDKVKKVEPTDSFFFCFEPLNKVEDRLDYNILLVHPRKVE